MGPRATLEPSMGHVDCAIRTSLTWLPKRYLHTFPTHVPGLLLGFGFARATLGQESPGSSAMHSKHNSVDTCNQDRSAGLRPEALRNNCSNEGGPNIVPLPILLLSDIGKLTLEKVYFGIRNSPWWGI